MLKQVVRPLFLGAVVAFASACGGDPALDPVEVDEVGEAEQSVCQQGSYWRACRDWGQGGFTSATCPGQYTWSYWQCSQYRYTVGSSTYYYRQNCGTQQYACGSSATSHPSSTTPDCMQTC